jgi:hypothetical protein
LELLENFKTEAIEKDLEMDESQFEKKYKGLKKEMA